MASRPRAAVHGGGSLAEVVEQPLPRAPFESIGRIGPRVFEQEAGRVAERLLEECRPSPFMPSTHTEGCSTTAVLGPRPSPCTGVAHLAYGSVQAVASARSLASPSSFRQVLQPTCLADESLDLALRVVVPRHQVGSCLTRLVVNSEFLEVHLAGSCFPHRASRRTGARCPAT